MKTLLLLWKAFDYSLQGVRNTFYDEIAFRIELAVAVILIPAALLLPVSLIVRILLIGSVLLVLIIELLNTAVEAAVNRISTEKHTLSAKAKDAGSAAVLMASINLVVVWGIVLFELIFNIS